MTLLGLIARCGAIGGSQPFQLSEHRAVETPKANFSLASGSIMFTWVGCSPRSGSSTDSQSLVWGDLGWFRLRAHKCPGTRAMGSRSVVFLQGGQSQLRLMWYIQLGPGITLCPASACISLQVDHQSHHLTEGSELRPELLIPSDLMGFLITEASLRI